MHYQALLVAYFSATAAGLPLSSKNTRQSIPGLGSGTGTGSGIPSLPSGLPGFGGDGTGSGTLPIPTGLLGGLGGSGTGSGTLPIPTGLLGGLGGGSGTPSLPTGIPGLGGDSSSTGSGTGLLSGLSGLTGGTSTGDAASADTASTSSSSAAAAADCKAVTVIFARGTTEPGTLGSVVGPGLQTALGTALNNNAAVTGVAYAADAGGIATEVSAKGGAGTAAMVKAVQAALGSCPDTQVVLSGYSQGAMLVHNTMNNLDAAAAGKVKAAVTFGDPFVGQAIKGVPSGAFKSFCASGDTVCSAGVGSSPSSGGTTSASAMGHLGYGSDTTAGAAFIKGKVTV
ncbi:hypothetical protein Daus18300_011198 [Diaporthe australafricana]|uniref:Cutinase n=1 Tax=Diaporthe australafricana TaxID=127596 RepID=A0ABR3W7G3_9PEZI